MFQHPLDGVPADGHRGEQVVERLNGEGLAVGHLTGLFGTGRGVGEVRPHTAGVHERGNRATGGRGARRGQLRVGDGIAHRGFASR